MLVQKESRLGLAPRRPSYAVCLTTDATEDALALAHRQAALLACRFGLTITHAKLVAELALSQPGRRA